MKRTIIKQDIITLALGLIIPFSSVATSFAATPSDIYVVTDKSTKYLTLQQQVDGSITGSDGASDWGAMAIAATGTTNAQLNKYIANETAPTTVSGIERKILALAATGQATSGYSALLSSSYQNNQIGDPALLNDDWFGVMAIVASKDTANYPIASDAINYIIAHQDTTTGGFSYCADVTQLYCGVDSNDTAAAVIALVSAQKVGISDPNLDIAITNAVGYLSKTQQSDGGFGYDTNPWTTTSDGASTSWVLMALNTLASNSLKSTVDVAQSWLIAAQDVATGSYGYEWNGYNADTITTANATLALLGTNWLLDPTPVARPVVVEAPVIVAPTTPVATNDTNTPRPVNVTPDTTIIPATATDTTAAGTSNSTVPQVEAATTTRSVTTRKVTSSNTARTFGISLIAIASIGFIAYGLITRRHRIQ